MAENIPAAAAKKAKPTVMTDVVRPAATRASRDALRYSPGMGPTYQAAVRGAANPHITQAVSVGTRVGDSTRMAGRRAAATYLEKKAAASALGAVAKRAIPVVGVAADMATIGYAGYQAGKASEVHSDLMRTARSLEKHGLEVETPSFSPLKAAFPAVFGEHPEPQIRQRAKAKGKLGS